MTEDRDFRRRELFEKYIAKMLYKYNDSKFESVFKEVRKELAKVEVSFSGEEILKGG